MSNTITVITQLCEEDRKRINELIGFAGLIASEMKAHGPAIVQTADAKPAEPQEAPEQPAPEISHPADVLPPHGEPEPAAAPEPVAEPELPKYTKADILAKVQKLAQPGSPKRAEAKAIIQSYAAKVSDIPDDKFTEVMLKLIALEG